MTLINSIFGKTSGITKEDIMEKIINSEIKENLTLEYKEITKLDDTQKERNIIKPLIGFLNSTNGNGLLILGIREKNKLPKELRPISTCLIKNTEQIRAIITSSITSVPQTQEFPKLTITSVPIDKKSKIFIVEIEKIEEHCVYSSQRTGSVYLRRNDETLTLSLLETIDLIAKRNFAKVFVYFEQPIETENEFIFNVISINKGFEPGRYVIMVVKFFHENDLNITLEGNTVQDVSNINSDSKKAYKISVGYPPNTVFLYPNTPTFLGKLKISPKKDFELKITVQTYENKGMSKQQIIITNKNGEISIQELSSLFAPYLGVI